MRTLTDAAVRALLLLVLAASCFPNAAPAPVPTSQLRVLTTAKEAHSLPLAEAARSYPVHLQAVVTYYDPSLNERRGALFVADKSGAIYVAMPQRPLSLKKGMLVEVLGVTAPGDFAPIVEHPTIRVIGESQAPAHPPRTTLTSMLTGGEDGQWREVEGLVQSVDTSGRGVVLQVAMTDGIVMASAPKQDGVDYSSLLDSRVLIHANVGPEFNRKRQLTGVQLLFPDLDAVTIEQRGPKDPFALPVQSSADLLRFTPDVAFHHRIHVAGRVTLYWPGRQLCIQGAAGPLCVSVAQASTLHLGDLIDLVGFPTIANHAPTLTETTFRLRNPGERVVPIPIAPQEAVSGQYDAALVRIEGQVVGFNLTGGKPAMLLSSGGVLFPVVLPGAFQRRETLPWSEGFHLSVTGVCRAVFTDQATFNREGLARPSYFEILVNSPDEVQVVARPSWWTSQHTIMVLGIVLTMGAFSILWIASLKNRVKHQTSVIRSQLDEAACLRDAAEAASRAKSDFLANMSHEIRTPMNAVQGFIGLALDLCKNEEQREYLKIAGSSAGFLSNVINDVLDLSKIEAHRLTLESVVFSPGEVIAGVTTLLATQADQKGLKLLTEVDSAVPAFVCSDPTRLRQVLINLIGNALKFTDAGYVTCRAEFEGNAFRISVADSGIGIPAERQESIFDSFTQADQSISRRFGGTGLGLTICKRIVEASGGRIWVSSTPGRGSTFHFTWPAEPACAPPFQIEQPAEASCRCLSILVVEDNLVNQKLISAMVAKMGHTVTLAADGDAACTRHSEQAFDLILMDLQMPRMNGLDATVEIRRREAVRGTHTRIVALTATVSESDCAACFSAGMDGYLTKPIQKDRLLAELAACSVEHTPSPLTA